MILLCGIDREEKRMMRLKLTYLGFGFILTYLIILGIHPALAQANTSSTEFVLFYRNEFTFTLCLLVLALGTWLGVKLPTGTGERDLSNSVRFVSALLGGILAFTYCLHKDKGLTLLNPLWIVTACIALPLTILTLQDKILAYAKSINPRKGGD